MLLFVCGMSEGVQQKLRVRLLQN